MSKFNELLEEYATVRAYIDDQEEALKPAKKVRDKIGQALLAEMNTMGLSNAKSQLGHSVTTVKSMSTKVEDREAWMNFVFEQGDDTFLTTHVSKEAIEAYLTEHNELPPGIAAESVLTLRFTKAKN